MYIIHMHCTMCKERPLLYRADAVSNQNFQKSFLKQFPIRLMDLVCNLLNRQAKFLTNIRGNSNCINVRDELLGGLVRMSSELAHHSYGLPNEQVCKCVFFAP